MRSDRSASAAAGAADAGSPWAGTGVGVPIQPRPGVSLGLDDSMRPGLGRTRTSLSRDVSKQSYSIHWGLLKREKAQLWGSQGECGRRWALCPGRGFPVHPHGQCGRARAEGALHPVVMAGRRRPCPKRQRGRCPRSRDRPRALGAQRAASVAPTGGRAPGPSQADFTPPATWVCGCPQVGSAASALWDRDTILSPTAHATVSLRLEED